MKLLEHCKTCNYHIANEAGHVICSYKLLHNQRMTGFNEDGSEIIFVCPLEESVGVWDNDFSEMLDMIKKLKKVNISNQSDMERCIKNLNDLAKLFDMYLSDNEQLTPIFQTFQYHLSILGIYEGKNFFVADISKKICIRLVLVFIGFINDYYGFINSNAHLGKDFEELIIA